jgi:RHS repeat-associated protein
VDQFENVTSLTQLRSLANLDADQVGSTVAITDDSQTVTDRFSYSPFGIALRNSGSTDTPFQFNGSFGVQTDANGLCYMRARYYNPRMMRFVNADPISFGGGSNWYAYCGNDPLSNTDPSGLYFGLDDAVAAGAGAVIGLAVQGGMDLYHGKMSPGSHYLAAAAGGAIAGAGTLYLGPGGLGLGTAAAAGISGAAGGAYANTIRQSADISSGRQDSFSGTSLALETGLGGAGSVIGAKVLPAVLGRLSNATKGSIGETTSLITNLARGNVPLGGEGIGWQVRIPGGGRIPRWDWQFRNIFTGSISTVESKFGTAGLTGAQRAGAPFAPNLSVEKWTYNFWAGIGAGAGENAGAFGRK